MEELIKKLNSAGLRPKLNVPLKDYTTIKVGGPADILVEVKSSNELVTALIIAGKSPAAATLLGKGSNVVISDAGLRGLTIINSSDKFSVGSISEKNTKVGAVVPRFDNENNSNEKFSGERVIVNVESGIRMQYLMNKLFEIDITGLENFAGIPCTLGGAVYMNLHGGNKFISDYLIKADLYSHGEIKTVDNKYFRFDYDWSILHETKEILLNADLLLIKGNGAEAKAAASEWAKVKSIQPKDSAGCIFKNLSHEQMKAANLPTPSIGYIIDKVLGMKGYHLGGARVSPTHAAFIENFKDASAKEIYNLKNLIQEKVREKLNIKLELEAEFKGEF